MSLKETIGRLLPQCATLEESRRALLVPLARFIASRPEGAELVFICTHNSRRSHMAQLWALAAAAHFDVPWLRAFSGGTEVTAFHPRAVTALVDAGFQVERASADTNPHYRVTFAGGWKPVMCFSKRFDETDARDFAAVMTCSEADEACPTVAGAAARFAVPYEDPKKFDGTVREATAYRERCEQIGVEMLFLLRHAKMLA